MQYQFLKGLMFVALLAILSMACGPVAERLVTVEVPVTVASDSVPNPPIEYQPEVTEASFPTEAIQEIPRTKILVILPYSDGLSQLDGLAFENGFDVEVTNDFPDSLDYSNLAGIIYQTGYLVDVRYDEEDLLTISSFVQDGGRAIILYSGYYAQYNDVLQPSFGVSVASELITIPSGDTFFYDITMLPSWLSHVSNLGILVDRSDVTVGLNSYLIVPGTDGDRSYVTDAYSGEQRLVYYANPEHTLMFFPYPESCPDACYAYAFLIDGQIGYFDNSTAAVAMLQWLLAP